MGNEMKSRQALRSDRNEWQWRVKRMHTYGAAQVGLFLFYQTDVLLKTWFPSSWGLCEESLGCYWHCQAQGFLAQGRQTNYCKTQKRANCLSHKVHKTCSFRKGRMEEHLFSLFPPTFALKHTEVFLVFLFFSSFRALSLQIFSRKDYFCSKCFPPLLLIQSQMNQWTQVGLLIACWMTFLSLACDPFPISFLEFMCVFFFKS